MRAIFSNKLSIPFDAKDKTRLKTKPNDFNEIKKTQLNAFSRRSSIIVIRDIIFLYFL